MKTLRKISLPILVSLITFLSLGIAVPAVSGAATCESSLGATSASFSDKDLREKALKRLNQLLESGKITDEDYDSVVHLSDPQTLDDLSSRKLISKAEFLLWAEIFELSDLRPSGKGQPISVRGQEFILLEAETSSDLHETLYFREKSHPRPVAQIHFEPPGKDGNMGIFLIKVRKGWRGLGLQEAVLIEALKKYPQTRSMSSQLAYLNDEIMEREIKTGKTPRQAFEFTPLYKSLMKLGFTDIEVQTDFETFIEKSVHSFKARKP